jgi:hypothetical protein
MGIRLRRVKSSTKLLRSVRGLVTRVEIWSIKPNHPTTVAFSRARVWDAVKIDQCLQNGLLHPANPPVVPANTVAKVVAIAKHARELSAEKRAML